MSSIDDFADPIQILKLVYTDVSQDIQNMSSKKIQPHLCFVLLTPTKNANIALARKKPISLSKIEPLDWIPYSQYLKDSLSTEDSDYLVGIYFGFVEKDHYVGVFTTPFCSFPKVCKKPLDKFHLDFILVNDPLSHFLFLNTPLEFDSNIAH
jgi:hypothetical protein